MLDVHYQELIKRPSAFGPSAEQRMYQWTTKAKEWEYEQEVRLIMPKPSQAYAALTPEQVKHPKKEWDWREITSVSGKRTVTFITASAFDNSNGNKHRCVLNN